MKNLQSFEEFVNESTDLINEAEASWNINQTYRSLIYEVNGYTAIIIRLDNNKLNESYASKLKYMWALTQTHLNAKEFDLMDSKIPKYENHRNQDSMEMIRSQNTTPIIIKNGGYEISVQYKTKEIEPKVYIVDLVISSKADSTQITSNDTKDLETELRYITPDLPEGWRPKAYVSGVKGILMIDAKSSQRKTPDKAIPDEFNAWLDRVKDKLPKTYVIDWDNPEEIEGWGHTKLGWSFTKK